jgi:hypothetical protein
LEMASSLVCWPSMPVLDIQRDRIMFKASLSAWKR